MCIVQSYRWTTNIVEVSRFIPHRRVLLFILITTCKVVYVFVYLSRYIKRKIIISRYCCGIRTLTSFFLILLFVLTFVHALYHSHGLQVHYITITIMIIITTALLRDHYTLQYSLQMYAAAASSSFWSAVCPSWFPFNDMHPFGLSYSASYRPF